MKKAHLVKNIGKCQSVASNFGLLRSSCLTARNDDISFFKRLLIISFASFILLLVFTTCTKEKRIVRNNTWEASCKVINNTYMSFTLAIIETVKNNNTDMFVVEIKSSEEWVTGKVKIGNNKINFYDMETYRIFLGKDNIPCAQSLINFLEDVNRYETNGATLILKNKKGGNITLINKKIG